MTEGDSKMSLIVDGKLTIPLYHGTSDLFYESIRQFGLGGRNVIMELRVIELLRELITICQTRLPNEEPWLTKMLVAERIAQQSVSRGGFNFRHGATYLTPSSYTAANYGTATEYGSEALGHFVILWDRLREGQIELSRDLADRARPIIDFAARPKEPILIRLDGVPLAMLASENGSDAASVIHRIERFANDKVLFPVMRQQANFELLGPMPISEGNVFRIVGHSRDHVKEPSLAPYRPAKTPAGPEA
jgi:hypothetical protein